MYRFQHLLSFALEHPWAVTRPMLTTIATVLAREIAEQPASPGEIDAALVNRKNLPQPRAGSVAVIPVYGVLAPRMNLMSDISGGTTYEKLTKQIRAAAAEPDIRTIVLDVDSPGGSVAGNAELAAEIMRVRTKKPVVAVAQYTMGSAAYHIGAAATEIVAAPSARLGSIGAYSMHNDLSEALAKLGVKRTYISAGEGKVAGNETEPLTDQARLRIQASVDHAYDQFVSNVVKGRGQGMTAQRVRDEWQAHVYDAKEALSLGMVDRIGTLDETLQRILTTSNDPADQRAALDLESGGMGLPTAVNHDVAALEFERQMFELQLSITKRD